jgi:hypothetical protein
MNDYTQTELENGRPRVYLVPEISKTLQFFYDDKEHSIYDECVKGLTYEEVIALLVLARESISADSEMKTIWLSELRKYKNVKQEGK